ncbi:MAG TPA: M1 family metallopeptidase [Bryobacteraceae bacterium]|nr:M1 family metallopeptidase [Bryobacteraceae bacterium]
MSSLQQFCIATAMAITGFAQESRDPHSFSNPHEVRVRHVDLDLSVSFADRKLAGTATLDIERNGSAARRLILDTRGLQIDSVAAASADGAFSAARFKLGTRDPMLGSALTVDLPENAARVRVTYSTAPEASGLQWLTPEQTADKNHPFLYTQSQAIHARSWIPLQDSPAVRVTYSARIQAPRGTTAIMSAKKTGQGDFRMEQSIPPYLIALAVGDLQYRAVSRRTGVYAEPSVVDKAAREFEDLDRMITAAEKLYGPYRCEQYDVLVLPPSFPYGGMENPRLTFVSSTLLAGDKSLVAVISHEIAHSWSGNLVTNATWRDFWLNEGFTSYLERRIQELVFGPERADTEALLERRSLDEDLKDLKTEDQVLDREMTGRDPDEIPPAIAYVKGSLLLRRLEEAHGRAVFDSFLRRYFSEFAFRSITTADFVAYLNKHLPGKVDLEPWLHAPGVPNDIPQIRSSALESVEKGAPPSKSWSTPQWLHYINEVGPKLTVQQMTALDKQFGLSRSGNAEILFAWLQLAIRKNYEPAMGALDGFLTRVGRRKLVRPLYQELAKTETGKQRGRAIYAKARPGYHPITQASIDPLLK